MITCPARQQSLQEMDNRGWGAAIGSVFVILGPGSADDPLDLLEAPWSSCSHAAFALRFFMPKVLAKQRYVHYQTWHPGTPRKFECCAVVNEDPPQSGAG